MHKEILWKGFYLYKSRISLTFPPVSGYAAGTLYKALCLLFKNPECILAYLDFFYIIKL